MNENLVNESQDIAIGNDCGRFVVSVKVGMGSEDMVTLPVAVWNYDAIVDALVRHKYSAADVEAIVQNKLNGEIDADEEYAELTAWRDKSKARAAYLMNLGEKSYDLVSEEWQERCRVTVDKVRKEKLAAIIAYDGSENVNGFLLNGVSRWLDKSTRMGLRQNIADKQALGESNITMWLGDIPITMPCQQADALMCSIENYAYECFNVTASHKAAIARLDTIDEIEAYDYTAGYPEKINIKV